MKLIKSLAVVALLVAPASAALAADPGLPTTPYSGDMKLTGGPKNETLTFKLYYQPDKQRMDISMGGQSMVVITDKTAKTATMLVPARKAYAVGPLKDEQTFIDVLRLKNAKYEVMGDEPCGAFTCVKYKAAGTSPKGGKFDGFMWFTKDHNILMKIDGTGEANGKSDKFAMVMENVKIGPIDPKVFAIPEGYTKMPGSK